MAFFFAYVCALDYSGTTIAFCQGLGCRSWAMPAFDLLIAAAAAHWFDFAQRVAGAGSRRPAGRHARLLGLQGIVYEPEPDSPGNGQ